MLTQINNIVIVETVLDKSEVLLCELQQTFKNILETATCVDVSIIWRFLQFSNFTRQKMGIVAKQRGDLLWAENPGYASFFVAILRCV